MGPGAGPPSPGRATAWHPHTALLPGCGAAARAERYFYVSFAFGDGADAG